MPNVLGLDLSLTSTGLAWNGRTRLIRPGKLKDWPRLRLIRNTILDVCEELEPALVVVEGPSFGSVGRGQHERGGLWWMVTEAIDDMDMKIGVAPPANIKKYATGVGGGPKADKDAVLLAAAKRFEWFNGNNDEADALWACAMGHEFLGEPIVDVPVAHKKAVETCSWPAPALVLG